MTLFIRMSFAIKLRRDIITNLSISQTTSAARCCVGQNFADIFSGVLLRSQRKYAVWPDLSPWSGLARVTGGDMGQRPDQETRNYPGSAHCKHWRTVVDTYSLHVASASEWSFLSSTCSLILFDVEWDTCNGPVSGVWCPPTPNISRSCNNPMMNLNCGADLAALNPAWPRRDAAIRCDTELGRSLELQTNLREVWNFIIMKKAPTIQGPFPGLKALSHLRLLTPSCRE